MLRPISIAFLVFFSGCGYLSEDIFVDATKGSDITGSGIEDNPYQTITKAISYTDSGTKNIKIQPGHYDASIGEIFPLILPENVNLIGRGTDAADVTIFGAGSYETKRSQTFDVTVVMRSNSGLNNVAITSDNQFGVLIDNDSFGANVSSSMFQFNDVAILVDSSESTKLYDNIVQNNDTGIAIQSNSSALLRRNTIDANKIGIYIDENSGADIGKQESVGKNTVSNNSQCDLLSESSTDVYAIGNTWDQNEFTFSVQGVCDTGENIVAAGTGTVIFQYVPTIVNPIYPTAVPITPISPTFGQKIDTSSPHMAWSATDKELVLAAIFDQPIIIKERHIDNTEDIVWLWHSGLGTANEGDVPYSSGVSVSNGDLEKTSAARELDIGRTYYWLVIAWDGDGEIVTHSSVHNYFITVP